MTVTIVPGDLDAFQSMEGSEKADWRRRAIDAIGKACTDRGQVGVVAGHYVLRSEKQEAGRPVVIEHDLKILTHILYLDSLRRLSRDVVWTTLKGVEHPHRQVILGLMKGFSSATYPTSLKTIHYRSLSLCTDRLGSD